MCILIIEVIPIILSIFLSKMTVGNRMEPESVPSANVNDDMRALDQSEKEYNRMISQHVTYHKLLMDDLMKLSSESGSGSEAAISVMTAPAKAGAYTTDSSSQAAAFTTRVPSTLSNSVAVMPTDTESRAPILRRATRSRPWVVSAI